MNRSSMEPDDPGPRFGLQNQHTCGRAACKRLLDAIATKSLATNPSYLKERLTTSMTLMGFPLTVAGLYLQRVSACRKHWTKGIPRAPR
jgi:hypothetical protein